MEVDKFYSFSVKCVTVSDYLKESQSWTDHVQEFAC